MNRRRWDRLAARFEEQVCDIYATDSSRTVDGLVDLATSATRRDRLVDLGCGIGTLLERVGPRFKATTGIDYSRQMLARARATCAVLRNAEWVCLDIPRAAARLGDVADLTTCLNVITSVSGARRAALWSSLPVCTRPGGRMLVVVPSLESALLMGARARKGGLVRRGAEWQKFYISEELHALLPRFGMQLLSLQRAYYPRTEEGLGAGQPDAPRPWDWACLARRSNGTR